MTNVTILFFIKVSFKSVIMYLFMNKHFNSKSHILNQNF